MLSPSLSATAPDYEKGVELLSKREFVAALKEFRGVVADDKVIRGLAVCVRVQRYRPHRRAGETFV